jgi:electron transfer flavoprotein alpha subunit
MTALCLIELDGAGPSDASLRALTLARGLAGGDLEAVVFAGPGEVPATTLAGYGTATMHAVAPAQVPGYAPLAWARVLAGLATATGARLVVAAGTDRGHEVMAHLGAITGLPVAANCVAAAPAAGEGGAQTRPGDGEGEDRPGKEDGAGGAAGGAGGAAGAGGLRITRQRWAGLLLEDALLTAVPALLTVAPDAVPAEPATAAAAAAVHHHVPDLAGGDLQVCARESAAQAGGLSLATARVVVGGGRGVGGPDGFAPLEELAGLLGGVLGVSRVVTSEGWRPHRQQVGQTGTRISPELYLACGISGAIQHMAGCQGAKHIVAVNTDPDAPIMARADYAVIGDLHEIIPALIAAIRERAGTS